MKLLVLSESANHVSCRYRVLAFEPALRDAGWDVVERSLSRPPGGFFRTLREAAESDVVLVQRRLLSRSKVSLLRRCARRLVYDVDDAVFLRDSNSSRPPESRRRRRRFQAIVAAADAIIAGNQYLAACAAHWSRYARIETIPTCVDPNVYPAGEFVRRRAGLRLAWIGSRSTLPSLNEIGPALSDVGRRLPGLELHVICDRLPDVPEVNTVLHRWSPETEAADLAQCDVGVSWLPDHPWSRGKCGLKVLQYMAAGLPVLANPIGVHPRMVTSDVNGLLVDSPDRLGAALTRLAASHELRRRFGRRGRIRVETDYSIEAWATRFVRFVEQIRFSPSASRAA